MKSSSRQFWQSFIAISIAISVVAIYQTEQQTQAFFKIRSRYKWGLVIVIFAINMGIGLYLLLRGKKNDIFWQKIEFSDLGLKWNIVGAILFIVSIPLLWYAKYNFFGKAVPAFFPLLWTWLWLTLLQATGIKILTRYSWILSFGIALLFSGLVFQFSFIYQPVTYYPFSLGWSEASRFYYGSLPFSKSIYGVKLPLSAWHGTRYFLLSLAFLFGKSTLWEARLWQAFLWLASNGLTAFLLIRRLKGDERTNKLLLGGWFFLYLFQGAVYYHLLICVIIIVVGVSPRYFFRSLIAIIIASVWAGMSRINWFPVPAILAIAIYLLEESFSKTNNFWQYLQKPFVWGIIGIISALAGQYFYIAISGYQDLSAFSSSLTSALLWYRWWPSDTNSLGVIPGVLLISIPPFTILACILRGRWNSLHPLRWFGILALLIILLIGGLIVSTKIGGGGDLHNMDAYIVLIGLITSYFMSKRVVSESSPLSALNFDTSLVINFLLIIPVIFALSRVIPPFKYDQKQAADDLLTLRKTMQSYSKDGEVLFIYERHLLTFGMIPNVPVVPEYEVISLTEMAISGNQPYLDKFYHDLEGHRFSAIVARKQNMEANIGDFAEESDIWNRLVAYPLLCEYEPVITLDSSNIQVFVPRATSKCPQP